MRIYTAFMVDGCIKTPISTPQRIIANAIWEIEGKKAGAQERRDEFQERGVYFEVGYADVDLNDIEKISLEQLAGKCEKILVTFTYSGYFNKHAKYPSWKWVSQ